MFRCLLAPLLATSLLAVRIDVKWPRDVTVEIAERGNNTMNGLSALIQGVADVVVGAPTEGGPNHPGGVNEGIQQTSQDSAPQRPFRNDQQNGPAANQPTAGELVAGFQYSSSIVDTAEKTEFADTIRKKIDRRFALSSKAKPIAMQNFTLISLGACILIASLMLVLVAVCCSQRARLIAWFIDRKLNPAARVALINHSRGSAQTSLELYFEYLESQLQVSPTNPMMVKWCKELSTVDVSKQIDLTFDAFRGTEEFLNKHCAKSLIASVRLSRGYRCTEEGPWIEPPRIRITDEDLGWLFGSWNDIFPKPVDRSSFQDLFRLVLTWMASREAAYTYMVLFGRMPGDRRNFHFDTNFLTVHVDVPGKSTPINIIHFFLSACHVSVRGRTAIQDDIGVREYNVESSKTKSRRRGSSAALPSQMEEDMDDAGGRAEEPDPSAFSPVIPRQTKESADSEGNRVEEPDSAASQRDAPC